MRLSFVCLRSTIAASVSIILSRWYILLSSSRSTLEANDRSIYSIMNGCKWREGRHLAVLVYLRIIPTPEVFQQVLAASVQCSLPAVAVAILSDVRHSPARIDQQARTSVSLHLRSQRLELVHRVWHMLVAPSPDIACRRSVDHQRRERPGSFVCPCCSRLHEYSSEWRRWSHRRHLLLLCQSMFEPLFRCEARRFPVHRASGRRDQTYRPTRSDQSI